ncbi:MAG: hypothetical protein GC154_19755 [bacterium]|nr:hypothetical protein [bacterium]
MVVRWIILMIAIAAALLFQFAYAGDGDLTQAPFYRAEVHVVPESPQPGDEVSAIVYGLLPNAAYSLIPPQAPDIVKMDQGGAEITLNYEMKQTSEAGADVLTETKSAYPLGTLEKGYYAVILKVNGLQLAYTKFEVGADKPILPDPSPVPAKLVIDPARPTVEDEVTFYVVGEFPSAGWTIDSARLEVMESIPEQLAVSLMVTEPTEPHAEVITPFRVIAGKARLSEGEHLVWGLINGAPFAKEVVYVAGKEEPKPDPVAFDMKLYTEPANPAPGETFKVFVKGVFPTTGYEITESSLAMTKSIPAQLIVSMTVKKTEGPVLDVLTPFTAEIGEAALPEGRHPIRGSVNGVPFYEGYVAVGDSVDPVAHRSITFVRSGGLIGWTHQLTLNDDGSARITVRGAMDSDVSGIIPKETLVQVLDLLNEINFDELEPSYKTDPPVADGYHYTVSLSRSETVMVEQGAEVPKALGGLIGVLEQIADGRIALIEPEPNPDPETYRTITFIRSGGFAGWTRQLTLNDDGSARITGNGAIDSDESGIVPKETLIQVLDLLNEINFDELEPSYKSDPPIADGYTYTISLSRSETVMAEQGAEVPKALGGLIDLLEQIVDGRIALISGEAEPGFSGITFDRQGGYSGSIVHLTLDRSGNANYWSEGVIDAKGNGVAPDALLDRINELVNAIDFSGLSTEYRNEQPYPDGYMFTVSLSRSETVRVEQGADAPDDVQALIDLLNSIVDGQVDLKTRDAVTAVSDWRAY